MTETWKPSEGLKRAEAVAAQIKDELAAAGVSIEPMYQWRMAQVIGRAIDEAMQPLVRTWVKVDAVPVTNGSMFAHSPSDGATVAEGLAKMASEISDDMHEETPPASAIHAAEEAPVKRGRGRPPGKKKDKKAGKKKPDAAVPDAAAAA